MDERFLEDAKQQKYDIRDWWKRQFNLSSNSTEFLTATELQMYEDYYSSILRNFNKEYADKESFRIARGRVLDPEFDRKENEMHQESMKNIEIINITEEELLGNK